MMRMRENHQVLLSQVQRSAKGQSCCWKITPDEWHSVDFGGEAKIGEVWLSPSKRIDMTVTHICWAMDMLMLMNLLGMPGVPEGW